ncbi:MAG: hypothetical protein HOH58_12540 [Opitutaceae bacterium]|jgi:hypothetical protein|nr:hypothetical protein [Opitutaceae bacterium]
MTSDLLILLFGLGLLWVPRGWLRLGSPRKKHKKLKSSGGPVKDRLPGDHSIWIEEEFKRRRNWIDFGRALGGSFAVVVSLPVVVDALIAVPTISNTSVVLYSQAMVLLAAVVIQMVRVEERLTLFPPIFFVMGLSFALVGWKAGMIGFSAIWAINLVLPNPAIFLATYGAGMVILGIFFGADSKSALIVAALAFMPPIVAVLFRRRLAQFRKRTKIAVR